MKPFIVLMLCFGNLFALYAPYLLQAQAITDSSVALFWRSNDTRTTDYYILSSEAPSHLFLPIDSIKPPTTSDTLARLKPSTKYYFAILAKDSLSISDTSNIDSVTTLAKDTIPSPPPIKPPSFAVSWDSLKMHFLLTYSGDSNLVATRFIIYRTPDSIYSAVHDTIIPFPECRSAQTWIDFSSRDNAFYGYKILSFAANVPSDTFSISRSNLFGFNSNSLIGDTNQQILLLDTISLFGINNVSWSMKVGDTIFVDELDSRGYSVIDISDRNQPVFRGFVQYPPYFSFQSVSHQSDCYLSDETNKRLFCFLTTTTIPKYNDTNLYVLSFSNYGISSVETTTTMYKQDRHFYSGVGDSSLFVYGRTRVEGTFIDPYDYHIRDMKRHYVNTQYDGLWVRDQTIVEVLYVVNDLVFYSTYFNGQTQTSSSFTLNVKRLPLYPPSSGASMLSYRSANARTAFNPPIFNPFKLPPFSKLFNGHFYGNANVTNFKNAFLDTIKKQAIVLTDSNLIIYNFALGLLSTAVTYPPIIRQPTVVSNEIGIFPNPFRGTTRFIVPPNSNLIRIYNIAGKQLAEYNVSTKREFIWNASSIPNGIYLLKVQFPNGLRIKHFTVIK